MHRFGILAIAVVLSTGCRGPRGDVQTRTSEQVTAASTQNPEASASTLGPGDLVEVRVYQEADLSNAFRISTEGTIDYPLCGKIKLVGMTASQAADGITKCLAAGYLKNPQVSVLIREYNSKKIFIFGEVQKPGTFPYEENMSVIQAVTLAGGFSRTAAKNSINVTRTIDGKDTKIRVAAEDIGAGREKNFLLLPGDIVFVPESFF